MMRFESKDVSDATAIAGRAMWAHVDAGCKPACLIRGRNLETTPSRIIN